MEDVPYGRILREGWLVIVVLAVFGASAAWVVAKALPETYAATSTMLLRVDSTEASLFERNQFSLARIKSYPALIDSPEVIDAVRSDLSLDEDDYSDRDIRRMLSAENTADTVLLVVQADAPTAALAADVANSAASHLSDLIKTTENVTGDTRYTVNLDQVLPAVEPQSPISPQVTAITGLGGVAGLAIGAIVAVYRTTTNRRLRTISDVRRATGLPVVGQIPRKRRVRPEPESVTLMAYEETVGNLAALAGDGLRTQLLVPASAGAIDDGTVLGLLAAQEAVGRSACVIDTRKDHVAGGSFSLDALLDNEEDPTPADEHDADDRAVIVADEPIAMETLLRELPDAIARLHESFDVVILISEPTDSALLETLVDSGAGIIVTVKHNSTSAPDLVAVATRLRVMGIRPVGVLMIHTGHGALGSIAESWRVSDRGTADQGHGGGATRAHHD
ncbi:MAG: hypothetical protein P0Y60_04315 [Candidatus Microbacterium colombiense]|nr:MAG: hypothetical protein P0Y60_04315 [Microbacterium sp.]